MGKYRSFVMLGIAVFIALIATVLIINWLQTKVKGREAPLAMQEVAVSKVDLKWGTMLTKEMIDTQPFLKKSLPAGHFINSSQLVGRVLIAPIKANEPILESRLAPTSAKTGGVAAVVNPKKRAIAVKVDKVIGVSGFIFPGNRVDVLVTIQTEKTQIPITKTVLENILVLTAGPEMESKGKEEKPSTVDVITLEVSPEEAEKLALAVTQGKIQLALRNFSDTDDVITRGVTIPTLLASYSHGPVQEAKVAPQRASAPKRPAPVISKKTETESPVQVKPPTYSIEFIKGTSVSEVKVEEGE